MKITVAKLRSVVREVLEDVPQTRRGLGRRGEHDHSSDDMNAVVPTQRGLGKGLASDNSSAVATDRGMGLEMTLDSLLANWDKHMGREPKDVYDEPAHDSMFSCTTCDEKMAADQVKCKACDDEELPKTMRSPSMK